MKLISYYLLFTFVIIISCDHEPTSTMTNSKASTNKTIALLDSIVPILQSEYHIPAVGLGMIEDGNIVFNKTFGASHDALFNVASVTKVIVSTTTLDLINGGLWSLDEPLFRYHVDPEVEDDPRHRLLTTRHVLSQQSGFDNWRWNHPSGKLTFNFTPGEKFQYSGEGMEYLRKALENKFDKSLSEIVDSVLFHPLAMHDSRLTWDGIEDSSRFCKFYDTEGVLHDVEDYSTTDNAADDLITSVEDLLKFSKYVMTSAQSKPELFQEITKTHADITGNLQQGLGWRIVNNLENGEYAIQHGGNDIGVAALVLLLPRSERGIVVLTNGDNGLFVCNEIARLALEEGREIIHKSYRSSVLGSSPSEVEVDPKLLESYAGKYEQASGRLVEISNIENKLFLRMPGTPILKFIPQSRDTFFLEDFDAKLTFNYNEQKEVSEAVLIEGENKINCVRLDI